MEYENNLKDIVSIIRNGEKPVNQFKLGVELEHIIVNADTFESVSYYGDDGIEGILKDLLPMGYRGDYEGDYLVGLTTDEYTITLEPGGQFEISIMPYDTIEEVKSVYYEFLEKVIPILEKRNLLLMGIGYHPKTSIDELPFNPKERYKYMSNYLKSKGDYAHNMMKGTAALQISIDYQNESDFIRKFRVANFITPLLYLISDNSPIFEGEVYNKFGLRSLIWENTDPARSGIVPDSLNKQFGYKDYAKYILNMPPILMKKDGEFISTENKTVNELMTDNTFTNEEIGHLMTMAFPDVRVKNLIEIRVGDSLPIPYSFAYIALIKGIIYNDVALEFLYNFSKRMGNEQIQERIGDIHENGFDARFGSKSVYDNIRIIFDLAKKSLSEEEIEMLKPLENLVKNKTNLSMIAKAEFESKGTDAFMYCSLNQWIKGDTNDELKKGI